METMISAMTAWFMEQVSGEPRTEREKLISVGRADAICHLIMITRGCSFDDAQAWFAEDCQDRFADLAD